MQETVFYVFLKFLSRFSRFLAFKNILNVFHYKNVSIKINVIQNSILMIFCIICCSTLNRWATQHGKIIIQDLSTDSSRPTVCRKLIHVAKFLSRFSTLFYFSPTFSIHGHFYLFPTASAGKVMRSVVSVHLSVSILSFKPTNL